MDANATTQEQEQFIPEGEIHKHAKHGCSRCGGQGYFVHEPGGVIRDGIWTHTPKSQRQRIQKACPCAIKRYAKANGIGPKGEGNAKPD